MNPVLFPSLCPMQGELRSHGHGGNIEEICMGAVGSFLLLSLPLSAERLNEQGVELWRGRSCSSAFAVELWGIDADPQEMYPEMLLVLFLPFFAEASL